MNSHNPSRYGRRYLGLVFGRGFAIGVGGLLTFYYLLLWAVTGDVWHPVRQFIQFQPWMSLLVVGFGIQLGLFWLMRRGVRFSFHQKQDAKLAAGAGTTVSGAAMVACCAHHIVEVLPILGLPAVAMFLTQYQAQFLMVGVGSNILGILLMGWFLTGQISWPTFRRLVRNKIG